MSDGQPVKTKNTSSQPTTIIDMLIIGAGFSGIAALLEAKRRGIKDVLILEKAQDVGGTWRENTYPGVACDVPSHLYCLASHPNPNWSHVYSYGDEIHDYLQSVARQEGIYERVRFGSEVTDAHWDNKERIWVVKTGSGDRYVANVLIVATGPLHVPKWPSIPGIDTFAGKIMHSARWDHDYDLTGKHVAVVGTGASAIQFVPKIAAVAKHLTVYQRSAPWVVPRPFGATSRLTKWVLRTIPGTMRLMRGGIMAYQESLHRIIRGQRTIGRFAQNISLWHMKNWIKDGQLQQALTPDYRIGCKRILYSKQWYPALARRNVRVETDAIVGITKDGVRTADGTVTKTDAILLATGFQASKMPLASSLRGTDGKTLEEIWADGMAAYLGSTVPGLPNFFMILGPNSGLGHNSVVLMAEAQAEHAVRMILEARKQGIDAIETKQAIHERFQARLQTQLAKTVWEVGGCTSWYRDANGRITTVWPGSVKEFQTLTRSADLEDFRRS